MSGDFTSQFFDPNYGDGFDYTGGRPELFFDSEFVDSATKDDLDPVDQLTNFDNTDPSRQWEFGFSAGVPTDPVQQKPSAAPPAPHAPKANATPRVANPALGRTTPQLNPHVAAQGLGPLQGQVPGRVVSHGHMPQPQPQLQRGRRTPQPVPQDKRATQRKGPPGHIQIPRQNMGVMVGMGQEMPQVPQPVPGVSGSVPFTYSMQQQQQQQQQQRRPSSAMYGANPVVGMSATTPHSLNTAIGPLGSAQMGRQAPGPMGSPVAGQFGMGMPGGNVPPGMSDLPMFSPHSRAANQHGATKGAGHPTQQDTLMNRPQGFAQSSPRVPNMAPQQQQMKQQQQQHQHQQQQQQQQQRQQHPQLAQQQHPPQPKGTKYPKAPQRPASAKGHSKPPTPTMPVHRQTPQGHMVPPSPSAGIYQASQRQAQLGSQQQFPLGSPSSHGAPQPMMRPSSRQAYQQPPYNTMPGRPMQQARVPPQHPGESNSPHSEDPEAVRQSLIAALYHMIVMKRGQESAPALLQRVDDTDIAHVRLFLSRFMGRQPANGTFPSAQISFREISQERFLRVVHEFMHSRGTPITSNPTIAGKRMNIYVIFMVVQSLGSYLAITRDMRWGQVAHNLGLSTAPEVVRELIQTYARLLLTFEDAFNSVPQIRDRLYEGLRPANPTAQNYSSAAASSPNLASKHASTTQIPTQYPPRARPASQQLQDPRQARPSDPAIQGHVGGPLVGGKRPLPGQQAPASNGETAASIEVPGIPSFKRPAMGYPMPPEKRMASGQGRISQPPEPTPSPESIFKLLTENGQYLLQRRHLSTYGGRDMRSLIQLGTETENWRPDVAFPLDLGTVDLHAITMSLGSHDPGEIRQALDKLVVVTADPRVHISLQHCPRLFANLCSAVRQLLNLLLREEKDGLLMLQAPVKTESLKDEPRSVADRIFEEASRGKHKPLVIEVDSETGGQLGQPDVEFPLDIPELVQKSKDQQSRAERDIRRNLRARKEHAEKEYPPMDPKSTASLGVADGDVSENEGGNQQSDAVKPGDNDDADAERPIKFLSYTERYERVEGEFQDLKGTEDEKTEFFHTAACNRLLVATCIFRNLSFADPNKPLIAKKPEFLNLLWDILYQLAVNPCLLGSELRTMDLCKDVLVVLSNVGLYLVLDTPKHTLLLLLFLLSFSVQETPYTKDGLLFVECDTEVHRYLANAIDVFAKITPRHHPNYELVESVLRDTNEDPEYRKLIRRYLNGRDKLEPCELLTRMFALVTSVMPYSHMRPPIDSRGLVLWQASLGAEILANMVPLDDDQPENIPTPWKGHNIAAQWLSSLDNFGARILRTINFMGMVILTQQGNVQEKTRPFARLTQRSVNIMRTLYTKARQNSPRPVIGIFPTIEHLLGGLMATEMDKLVVRHLEYLYNESHASRQEVGV